MTIRQPLAERMRPRTLADYVGQGHLVGDGKVFTELISGDNVHSMLLWGPPGTGKTTLARIIASETASHFVQLSAINSGVKDIRAAVENAESYARLGTKTILFIDEVHRFNKSQQDSFLPSVEDGTITFIGATTENPSFEVNNALLSRTRTFVLKALTQEEIVTIIDAALKDKDRGLGTQKIKITKKDREYLAHMANGDARTALNALELAVQLASSSIPAKAGIQDDIKKPKEVEGEISSPSRAGLQQAEDDKGTSKKSKGGGVQQAVITRDHIDQALQKSNLLYDRAGDEHYNIISAFHKSMRGGDADASLYWLTRMLAGGEDPLYVARRIVRFASEDIGLANSFALPQATAAYDACRFIGMPECGVNLAQAAVYMAKSKKSISVYEGYKAAMIDAKDHGNLPVPLHLRNAPTKLMKELDYGKDYKYTPQASREENEAQEYMPGDLKDTKYLTE